MAARTHEQHDQAINIELATLEKNIKDARGKHNAFLKEVGLPPLP